MEQRDTTESRKFAESNEVATSKIHAWAMRCSGRLWKNVEGVFSGARFSRTPNFYCAKHDRYCQNCTGAAKRSGAEERVAPAFAGKRPLCVWLHGWSGTAEKGGLYYRGV